MNANTLKAMTRHGESLLKAFPHTLEKNPVALCKKLRRIETSLARPLLDYCNTGGNEAEVEKACDRATVRVCELLNVSKSPHLADTLHINRDPRGSALKLDDGWVKTYNDNERRTSTNENCRPIWTDMGGYGILAPDLNTR